MDGRPHQAGLLASGLRKALFREHLGLGPEADLTDPICSHFYDEVWRRTATRNTSLYDEMFSVLPTDSVGTRQASRELQLQVPKAQGPRVETLWKEVRSRLESIQGHLVDFPTRYLSEEDLQPSKLAKEGIIQQELWT